MTDVKIISAAEQLDRVIARMRAAGISEADIATLLRSQLDRLNEDRS